MQQVKLGELFLLRRNIKKEIDDLGSEVTSLVAYREDRGTKGPNDEITERDEFYAQLLALSQARKKLHQYDMKIESANSEKNTVNFKEFGYSLNEARHLKVHLQADLTFNETLLLHAISFSKRTERDTVYEDVVLTTGTQPMAKQVERKFIVIPEMKAIKERIRDLKQDIQLLDSSIQQVDWKVTLEIE